MEKRLKWFLKKKFDGGRKQTEKKNKLTRGHLDTLSARVYFRNGKERSSRSLVTSDWQLTVQCLSHSAHFLFFVAPFFNAPSFTPFSPAGRLVYWLWQRHQNSISLWQRSRWRLTHSGVLGLENQSQAGWEWWGRRGGGGKEGRKTSLSKQLPPDHLFQWGIFFFFPFPQQGKENPRERGRGQTYLGKSGKVSRGKGVWKEKPRAAPCLVTEKVCQRDNGDNLRLAIYDLFADLRIAF